MPTALWIIECACSVWQQLGISLSQEMAGEARWVKTDRSPSAPENQDSKQLWKYRWQSLVGELLSKDLIESSCQGSWSNQRTCVFQVEKGHVESTINPASWSTIQRQLFSAVVAARWCCALWDIVPPCALMCNSFLWRRLCIVASVASNFTTCFTSLGPVAQWC